MDLEDLKPEWDSFCAAVGESSHADALWEGAKVVALKKDEPDTYLKAAMRKLDEPWIIEAARRRAPKQRKSLSELRGAFQEATGREKEAILAAAYVELLEDGVRTNQDRCDRQVAVQRWIRDNCERELHGGVLYDPPFTWQRGIQALKALKERGPAEPEPAAGHSATPW